MPLRVRKLTDRYASRTPTRKSERLYLGDCEFYREYAGDGTTVTLQRTTDHISDEHGRFALQERTGTQILLRYNHADPLENSRLETDATGRLIAYEEYHAYGTTAYQATLTSLAPGTRRYRYAGKERDEESGLYYFGARYYAPWLGRFLSVDPKASKYVEWSPYIYTLNNPIRYVDPDGQEVKYTISNSYQGKDGKLHIVYKVDISIVLVKANRATQARLKLDEVAENLQAKLIKAVTVNSSSKTTVIEFKPGNVQVRAAYDLTGVKPKEHVGVIVDDVTGTTVDKNGKIGQAGRRAGYGKLTIYSENIDNNAERTAEVLLYEMGHSMGLEHNWVSSFTDDNADSNPMSYANIPDGVFSPDQMLKSRDWYLGGKLNTGPNVQMLKKEDYSNSLTTEKHPYSYGNPGDVFPASIDL